MGAACSSTSSTESPEAAARRRATNEEIASEWTHKKEDPNKLKASLSLARPKSQRLPNLDAIIQAQDAEDAASSGHGAPRSDARTCKQAAAVEPCFAQAFFCNAALNSMPSRA